MSKKTPLGQALIEAAEEARAIVRGEIEPAAVYIAPGIDIVGLRKRLSMTQDDFADAFGFSVGTIRGWEQGRRSPDKAAQSYLKVISADPDAVLKVLRAA